VQGGGACGELIRAHAWERTSLGPIAGWPVSLRATVANMLHTRQPMLLFWGPDLIQFYSDAFVPSFGLGRHPAAMGQAARECWKDAWPVIGAQIDAVLTRGEPAWFEDALVPIERNGRMEEVFWTYSYSAAYNDAGEIYGTLVIVTETSARVRSARRLEALSKFVATLSTARSRDAAFDALGTIPTLCPQDAPFIAVFERGDARPSRCWGIEARQLDGALDAMAVVDGSSLELPRRIQSDAWPESIGDCFFTVVGEHSHRLIFGLSPRLPFDHGYRSYLTQISEQIGSALDRVDHATTSLAIEQQRNNLLLQAPVATALMIGPTHVFQLANALYCRVVGRDPVGMSYLEAFPELAGSPLPGILDRVYATGEPFCIDEALVPLIRSNAGVLEDCYFNFNLEALRDVAGVVFGMMAVAVDVTEQVRARKVLEKTDAERRLVLKALEEASRAKDEFLAMLGHELRNPLAPISAALELMAHKDHDGKLAHERDVIERQLRHMVRLVGDLLDVSRITSRAITLEKRMVDLAGVVAAAAEATSHLFKAHRHRLSIEAQAGLSAYADEARLVQIVVNLLTNAAKYTPDDGQVAVTLRSDGSQAVLEVADTGIGIAPSLLPRVFDLFVQDEQSIERARGGLGIGLAIVRNLVALHDGSVAAHSAGAGTGSVFTVRLPLVDKTPNAVASPALPVASAPTPKRVLIVDDNEDAAELTGDLLRTCGHEVVVVHDPVQALHDAETFRPDVALLDIGLPGMDGYELAARLRKQLPACTLIAVTGYGQGSDAARAYDAGFTAHIVKPATSTQLLDVIARA
jgi:signal transduction histidine kinase/BarA-like signal transduction histidine kinase